MSAAQLAVHLLQEKEEERLREEFAKQGIKIPVKEKSELFDSNTITPGTPFMHRLSIALQYYIHCRLNKEPGWKNITVSLAINTTYLSPEGIHQSLFVFSSSIKAQSMICCTFGVTAWPICSVARAIVAWI